MYRAKDIEESVLAFWVDNNIYNKVKEKARATGKPFYFLDGPPYATGEIHPGTAWNKSMKDALIRYYRMIGYDVQDKPGFDTHGLPIEVKVEKLLGVKNKGEIESKFGIDRFIAECKSFADKYIAIMTNQFKRLGIWMDWENPYITYKDSYIEKSWAMLKKAWEKNLMKEDVYVLPYCYRCGTTLANHELEYKDEIDPSIFVKFKVKGRDNEYLIIWTTTPWTLVSNMAVMAHPDYDYVKVSVGDEVWILAKERLDALFSNLDVSPVIIEEFKGKDLEGLEYEHPFQDLINKEYNRRVVLSSEFVTLEEGTGLVHTAPGHGPEDFKVGKENNIEIFCPVDTSGNYTDEAGVFKGMNVRDANPKVIEVLKERNALVFEGKITHRYPHCWRCKTPLIYITTKQWFISITKLKDKLKEEIEKTDWVPSFAEKRFLNFVDDSYDWCISRQRYWGIPLPIWRCEEGHTIIVSSKKELEELSNSKVKELHRPFVDEVKIKCPVCGKEMKRVPDVLDVWFDSGNATWASLSDEEIKKWGEKSDVILEGQDQIRGWFYTLLGCGVIKNDEAPYKRVIMHGFFLNEKGEEMSKSLGNFVPIEEIINRYGADPFRLFGLSNTIWEDLKFNWDEVKKASDDLNILVNLVSYLSSVNKEHKKKFPSDNLRVEDKWILSRLNSTLKVYHSAFKKGEMNVAAKSIRKLLVEDVSKFYMKILKERIRSGDEVGRAVLYNVMFSLLRMFAPFTPMVVEHLYQKYYREKEGLESIHMHSIDEPNASLIDETLEERMEIVSNIISGVLKLRNDVGVKIRWPISGVFVEGDVDWIDEFKDIILLLTNAKSLKREVPKDGVGFDVNGVNVYIEKSLTDELKKEGYANEVIRRIQVMRKGLNLIESDRVSVSVYTEDEMIKSAVESFMDKIKERVGAVDVRFENEKGEGKEWKIDGKEVWIDVVKL